MDNTIYENTSINKLMIAFGAPSIIALLIEMATGVIDTIFAGNIAGVGSYALSAMALIGPILALFTSLQTLFAASCGLLVSRYLTDKKYCFHSIIIGIFMSGVVSISASLICALNMNFILETIGAQGEIFTMARVYMEIEVFSNVLSSLGYTMCCIIRSLGFPKMEMVIVVAAVIVNVAANALLCFGLDMGIAGLAWGTFVSELFCMMWSLFFLFKHGAFRPQKRIPFKNSCKLCADMFKIGFAQTVIQAVSGCTGFFINAQLLSLGCADNVAAWSIAQRIYMVLLMPIVGLTQGVQTIIAYFNGQNKQNETKELFKKTILSCFVYGLITSIMMIWKGNIVCLAFGGTPAILEESRIILVIICSTFSLVGVFYTNMTLLQVVEHEVASVILALLRQVVLIIPLIVLIPYVFESVGMLPILGLYIVSPFADVIVIILSMMLIRRLKSPTHTLS